MGHSLGGCALLLALSTFVSVTTADLLLSTASAFFLDASVVPAPVGEWVDLVPSPITLALTDLKQDWYKVIGIPPTPLDALPTKKWDGDVIVVFKIDAALPSESFTVIASTSGVAPTLTVTGADVRGLVYGMYHVSADFLGVDPFWWWNDQPPVYEPAGITVTPDYSYDSGAPAFLSRGAFNNDEDLSGYFAPSPLGDAVYHTTWANRFCETLLRLRANTFIPSTFAFIDESPYKVAAKRGLKLGNHHVMPVGNNVAAWPKGVSYAYRLNPQPFVAAWTALTDYQQREQGREMVYSLGYRGVNDEPFWNMDTGCKTDECRGHTVTQAIANESAIAMSTPTASGKPPQRVAYMWMELLELKEAGTLTLPPDVACIWTDFPGAFLFEGGFDNVTVNDGFYGHISMMNGQAGQLVEFIPPARIFANVWEFLVRKATAYGMINLSDLKFVPLTAEAVYRYLWSPASFNASASCAEASVAGGVPLPRDVRTGRRGHTGAWPMPRPGHKGCTVQDFGGVTPAQAQEAFILEFSNRHYGAAAGTAAALLYQEYFNISYMANAVPGQATQGDHWLGGQMRSLTGAFEGAIAKGDNKSATLRSVAEKLAGVAAANLPFVTHLYVDGVVPLAATVPAGGASRFYAAHLAVQSAIHFGHLSAFKATAEAALAWLSGDTAGAAAGVNTALAAFDSLLAVLRAAEGPGAWHGSYAADGWTWCWGSRVSIAHLQASLAGKVIAAVPSNPYPDYAIMGYEFSQPNDPTAVPTFPFASFNATIAWDVVPRFACAADIPGSRISTRANGCDSTWVGVTLSKGTTSTDVGLFTAPYSGPGARAPFSVRYTLDGSPVTPASPKYMGVFKVSAPATVRARSYDDASGAPLGVESSGDVSSA